MTAIGNARQSFRRRVGSRRPALSGGRRIVQWGRDVATADLSAAARVATWILGTLAGLALWIVVFAVALSGLQERHDQHALYSAFRAQLATGTAPLGGAIPRGAPVALLSSDAGGLDGLVVVEGTTGDELRSGPGHVPGSPLPGQAGYSVVFGRSTSYGGPFGAITSFASGDSIVATTGQGVFHYVVQDVRRAGDPFPPALASGGSRLTLVTSEGLGWAAGLSPSHAVYVDAVLTDKSVAAPAGTSPTSAADGVLQRDTSGMYPMILWLQLLVLAVVAVVWAAVRWGRWQSWLVGAPVVVAALWGATSQMWLLLPNVL